MRQSAAVIIFLCALTCAPSTLLAQSGRNRTPQSISPNPTTTNQPSDSSDSRAPETIHEVVDSDVIRVDTALVTVPVSVRDRDGRYAPDLKREDFRIYEDGVEQRIAYFATVDQPFTLALMLDTSGSTTIRLEDMQDAAINFMNQLKPADRVLIIAFDDRINVLTAPTNDRAELTRAIRHTHTGGGTRLYDAVDQVINQQLRRIPGRKAIVLFTDGVDTTSRHATYESTVRAAEESDALIYPVDYDTYGNNNRGLGGQWPMPGGRGGGGVLGLPFPRLPGGGGGGGGGPTSGDYRRADAYLHELAQRSGGRFYRGDSMLGLAQSFAWIAEELRRQYSLGYYPKTAGQAGQRRQIKVRVDQPGLVALTRDSYIYAEQKPAAVPNDQPPAKTTPQGKQFGR
jgi:VWFA-related protein